VTRPVSLWWSTIDWIWSDTTSAAPGGISATLFVSTVPKTGKGMSLMCFSMGGFGMPKYSSTHAVSGLGSSELMYALAQTAVVGPVYLRCEERASGP